MINKKGWEEFRKTGLLLVINQFLHLFGWAIVFDYKDETLVEVFPARVKFRGFDNVSVDEGYKKVTQYLKDNIEDLHKEANE